MRILDTHWIISKKIRKVKWKKFAYLWGENVKAHLREVIYGKVEGWLRAC